MHTRPPMFLYISAIIGVLCGSVKLIPARRAAYLPGLPPWDTAGPEASQKGRSPAIFARLDRLPWQMERTL